MYGKLTLVTGAEAFLIERRASTLGQDALEQSPDASLTTVAGRDLTAGVIDQLSGTDLFSSATVACVMGAEQTPSDVVDALIGFARLVPDNVALIISQAEGQAGKALLNVLRGISVDTVEIPAIKAYKLPEFVGAEVRGLGKVIGQDGAQALVEAVGQDVRALAAAASQLVADTEEDLIPLSTVQKYFSGRSTVSAFAVGDDAVAGRVGDAIVKLRWALSTGVEHKLVTGALATTLRQLAMYLTAAKTHRPTASDVGVPQWKINAIAGVATSWSDKAVASAIRAVAQADAQIKGAAQDPDYALERLILRIAALRRAAKAQA